MSFYIGTSFVTNSENFIFSGFYQTTQDTNGITLPTYGNDLKYYSPVASDNYGYSISSGDGVIAIGVPNDEVGTSGNNAGGVEVRFLFRGHTALINSSWTNTYWSESNNTLRYYYPHERLPDITAGTANYGLGTFVRIHRGKMYVSGRSQMSETQASGLGSIISFGLQYQYNQKIQKPTISGWNDTASEFGNYFAVGCGKLLAAGTEGSFSRAILYNLSDLSQYIVIDHPDGQADTGKFGIGDTTYGGQMDIGCNRLVIGASYDKHISAVDGSGNPLMTGRAWIFDIDGNVITELAHNDSPALDDRFGHSVAIGCGLIVVACPNEESQQEPVTHNDGALYVYSIDGEYLYKIESHDANDQLGSHVRVKYNRIYVTTLSSTNQNDSADVEIYTLDGDFIQKISHISVPSGSGIGANGIDIGSGQRMAITCGNLQQSTSAGAGGAFLVERTSSQNIATYYDEYIEYYRY